MSEKDKIIMTARATAKTVFLMAAIDTGLIKKTRRGYNLTAFEKFWEAARVIQVENFGALMDEKCKGCKYRSEDERHQITDNSTDYSTDDR